MGSCGVIATIGFSAAALFMIYVLFGYPMLLDLLARRRPRPVRRAPIYPRISIIIAVHNGEEFLEAKLRSVLALDYPRDNMEILVISDGSTDATDRISGRFSNDGVRLLRIARSGKPSALNAGIAESRGEVLVLTDVRQILASDSVRLLLENLADPSVGVASGELSIWKGPTREEADVGLYWRYELWIRLRLSSLDSIFGATGALYAIRRELAVPIPPDALLDDMYLPLPAFFKGLRLIVDSRARMFDYATGLSSEFRRKVRTLAGNYQILRAYPQLLGPGNRLWFHFWSYKFARLLLPLGLIGVAVFAIGLPSPWARVAALPQGLFYAAALSDTLIPEGWLLKRFTSPARTFVTLVAAALCAISIFFLPTSVFWKNTRVQSAERAGTSFSN